MIMKRFAILVAVVALIGCTQNDKELDNITNIPSKSQTEFYASMPECNTRTYVEDNKYLRWNAGDEITVFAGNSYNGHWQFAGEDGTNSGKFNEVDESGFVTGTPLDLTANYAIYPYDENITITEAGVVSLTLPAVQAYNHTYANSFGEGANTMMAVTQNTSDNFLAFKNLCGYLKLKFYGENVTVKSVTVKGNNGEKIAGKATVSMAYGSEPTITMGGDATDTITIDCGEGVALSNDAANPTTFWVVIPEITFEGGITIEVTDINDQTFSKQTTNAVPIENNLIQPMATLGVETAPAGPANNEIWYTNGSTTEATTPYRTYVFGANIISNTYDTKKECWVIEFDGDVTSIGNWAFRERSSLTSITIPDSATIIGEDAFYNCSNLTSVIIGDSVTTIGNSAFSSCNSLTSLTIGDSVTTIGDNVFRYCRFTSVTIPDSVTSIEEGAFIFCYRLTEFKGKFASEDSRCLIVNGTLNSFAIGCGLTEYTIPDSVTRIGENAFDDCSSLTSITIPDSVASIGYMAFGRCSSLTSITIPDSVAEIEDYAFAWCESLTSAYCKATTPPSLGGTYLFYDIQTPKIYVPAESLEEYRTAESWSKYAGAIVAYDFENDVVVVPEANPNNKVILYTTTSNVGLYSANTWSFDTFGANILSHEWNSETGEGVITFDADVTTIGKRAFDYCRSLTSITIPDSVTSIGDNAFSGCSSLTSMTIPDSVTCIGSEAFENCSRIAEFKGMYASEDGRCLIIDGTLNSFAIGCGATEYTIPEGVTSIGDCAFEGCTSLTSITIPNSVTSIGDCAFEGCTSLTSITIPNSVTSIEGRAFYECTSLTSVTIGNGVTSIGYYAFRKCTSLESITIPDSVTEIGESAFYYCSNLKSVTFGSCVRKIEMEAFCGCSSLTSVTIPDSVLKIGEEAFCNCSSLKSVTIGNGSAASIETGPFSIEYAAFANCRSLTSVYCKATTPPRLGEVAFKYYNDGSFYNIGCKIYVPRNSISAYKSAEYWKDYASQISADPISAY